MFILLMINIERFRLDLSPSPLLRWYLLNLITGMKQSLRHKAKQLLYELPSFQLVVQDQASDFNMTSGRHPANVHKNRHSELIPTESSRVCITPQPGVECSDYINASWLPGFNWLREFIVTQHPLPSTLAAFWQMVWDHNAQTIVLLSPVDDQVRRFSASHSVILCV